MEIGEQSSNLTCKVCSETFSDLLLLECHLQINHKEVFTTDLLPNGIRNMVGKQFKRQCPFCVYLIPFTLNNPFKEHLWEHHNILLDYDKLEFDSESQFYDWKLMIEKLTSSLFISYSGRFSRTLCSGVQFIQYRCKREGTKKIMRRKTNKATLTDKTGFACPASIDCYIKKDGSVKVLYCSQHMGHDAENHRLYLTQDQKEKLADLIARGFTFTEIIENIRTFFDGPDLNNMVKVTKSHLNSIRESMRERAQKKLIENSGHADELFQHFSSLPDHHIVAYKPTENPDDFCIVIMTKQQKQLLHKFGNNNLCIDSAKTFNKLNLNVLVVLVEDQFYNGHPVAFCITNLQDEDVCDFFFNVVKERLPREVQASYIFTDEDKIYANAWMKVMGFSESKLCLSHWHLEKKWKMMLDETVSNEDKRKRIYHRLRFLITSKRAEFDTSIKSLMEEFSADDELSAFGKYFEDYFSCAEAWAFCFRPRVKKRLRWNGMGFVMYVVAAEVRKHLSIVSLVLGLLMVAKEAFFRQNMEIHTNPTSSMLCETEEDHEKSNRITDDMITRSDAPVCWDVKSPDNNLTFAVSWQLYPVCKKRCPLICKHCEICPHMYYCVCPYNLIYEGICEHIHALAVRRKLEIGFGETSSGRKASHEHSNLAKRKLQKIGANSKTLCQGVDHNDKASDSNELANISLPGMETNCDISSDMDHSMDRAEAMEQEVNQVLDDKLQYMHRQIKTSSMSVDDKNQLIAKLNSCISFIHSKEVAHNIFSNKRSTELSNGSPDVQS